MLVFSGSVSPSCHSSLNYSERQRNVLFLPFSRVLQLLLYVISLLWICKWKQEEGIIVQWCILGLWRLSKLVVMDLPCTAYSLNCHFVRKPSLVSPAYTERWWEIWKGTSPLIQSCTFLRMSLNESVVFKFFSHICTQHSKTRPGICDTTHFSLQLAYQILISLGQRRASQTQHTFFCFKEMLKWQSFIHIQPTELVNTVNLENLKKWCRL